MKKLFSRITATVMAFALGASFVACGTTPTDGGSPVTPKPPVVTPEEHVKAEAVGKAAYDKAVGGELAVPFRANDSAFFALRLDDVTLDRSGYVIDPDRSLLTLDEKLVLALADGDHSLDIVTDDGTLSVTLKVKNTVPIDFDGDTVRNYRSGDGDMTFVATGASGIKSVVAAGIEIDAKYYACANDKFVLKSELLEKLNTVTDIDVTFDNNSVYRIRVFSDALLSSDFDAVVLYDDTVSDWGLNSLCQDSKMMSIVSDGIDGNSLAYTPALGSYAMGEWARAFFTIKDPTYYDSSILWHSVDFDNSGESDYEISFDYRLVDRTAEDAYTLVLLTDGSDGFFTTPVRAGIDFPLDCSDGEVKHFSKTINGSLFKGLYFYAESFSQGSSLQIDNVVVRKKRISSPRVSLDKQTYRYSSAVAGDFTVSCRIDGALTIGEILVSSGGIGRYVTVDPDNYAVTEDGIVFDGDFVRRLSGDSKFLVFFSDEQSVGFEITSNVRFFSDYDEHTVLDGSVSEHGANAFANDTKTLFVQPNGIEGNSLVYSPGNASYVMGSWANRVMTFKNPDVYDFTWYSLAVNASKKYRVSFDYRVVGDCAFSFVLFDSLGNVYVSPETGGTVYRLSSEDTSFSVEFYGRDFYGMMIYAPDGYKGDGKLLIDNFTVEEVE